MVTVVKHYHNWHFCGPVQQWHWGRWVYSVDGVARACTAGSAGEPQQL